MGETCYVVNPAQRCSFCHHPFSIDDERELVMVESGQMMTSRKDPNWLYFFPDHQNEHDKNLQTRAVLEIYHADCFLDRMRGTEWGSNSPLACDLCELNFRKVRWAFRIKLGRQDFETAIFVPLDDPRNQTILCPECIADGFGEGNTEEGMLLLGARR